jgi:DNA helicase-2/ATP-dependent DNA helicase PcrA
MSGELLDCYQGHSSYYSRDEKGNYSAYFVVFTGVREGITMVWLFISRRDMDKNTKFLQLLEKLNIAQRQAVDTVEGAVMVIAGPGTGKTQILTLRIANILLRTDVNPENILALTFTESGVMAMRKRLVSIIGTPGYRVNIYTFHGFCNDLIQNNVEEFPHLIASDAATELDQIAIVEGFIKNSEELHLLRPFGDPLYYVKPALAAISDLKKEGITVEKFAQALEQEAADFEKITDLYHEKGPYKGRMKGVYEKQQKNLEKNQELVLIYQAYQEGLRKKNLYDFNDMLLEVIAALETKSHFLLRLQEQYQYFLVDEHQDTNAAQNRIVELLCNYYDNPNLFVVGDEKQAIYRFQGASLENFLYFKKLYPEAVLINLTDNYRSSQTILDASGSVINKNVLANKLLPNQVQLLARSNHPEEQVKIIQATDFYSEYYAVGEQIKQKIQSGAMGSEIAILGKENRDLLPFVDVFERLDIPYTIESNQNILSDIEVQKLLLLFRTVAYFGSDEFLVKAMHIDCLEIHPVDIYKLLQRAKEEKITLWDLLLKLYQSRAGEEQHPLQTEEKILAFYQRLLEWRKMAYNERFDFLFKHVVDNSGFLKSVLGKRNALGILDKVTALYEEVKGQIERNPLFTLDDFMEYLHLIEQHEVQISKTTRTIRKEAVRLMTAHRSKGLEFDYVYIIAAFDGHWGNARKRGSSFTLPWPYLLEKLTEITSEEKNEDERRLFYVALTRARKEVTVSYSVFSREGKAQVASQFIDEILENYRTPIDISDFEKDFLANKQIIIMPAVTSEVGMLKEYIHHKDYFNELFRLKGFAVTHLNNYLTCPWRYFFHDLIAVPEPMEKTALYGSAIHRALNAYLRHLDPANAQLLPLHQEQTALFAEMTVTQPKDTYAEGLAFLISAFDRALSEHPLRKQDMEDLLRKGKKALTGYYAKYMTEWKKQFKGEFPIRGIRISDDVMLTGRLDMIEPVAGSDEVIVYDFKSGKPKSRGEIEGTTKNSKGDYKRQLVFYKLLLDKYQYKKMHMRTGVIDFVEPTEKGEYKREVFTIGDEEVMALEAQIKQVTDEILNLSFWDKRCGDKECLYCELRSYMGA